MTEHAYIHIPFCIRKCNYCSFVSGYNIEQKEQYIYALTKEIQSKYNGEPLKTLYFGGGTPSLLNANDIKNLVSLFNFQDNPEITLEANPETVEKPKFKGFKEAGVNRISLGVQTFNNEILNIIGRKHTEEQIYNAIQIIKNTNFNNISIDLIYGLPTQTMELFKLDLDKALKLDIQHISTYGLKIEDESYFGKNPPTKLPNDELQAEMYLYLIEKLNNNEFEHYEISNFALPTYYSKHNCCYWQNKNYYGFGLNASGYENNTRYKNCSIFKEYINNPFIKEEETILSIQEQLEEEIFLGLRLKQGINIKNINKKFNIDFQEKYKQTLIKYPDLLKVENEYCYLTENGFLLSNNIMSEFLT